MYGVALDRVRPPSATVPFRSKETSRKHRSRPVSPESGWVRGSVGSAKIWDEASRAAYLQGRPLPAPAALPKAPPAAPQPVPSLTPRQKALLARLQAEIPELAEVRGLRKPLVAWITGASLEPSGTSKPGPSPELDLLRRRASKLVRELRKTRGQVLHNSGQNAQERGISSVYRTAQGLSHDSENAKAKRGMLEEIFRANLELRRQAS